MNTKKLFGLIKKQEGPKLDYKVRLELSIDEK